MTDNNKKPASNIFYNNNKSGVDLLNYMARMHDVGLWQLCSTFVISPVSLPGYFSTRRQAAKSADETSFTH
jgi:hypothetical protein